MQQKAAANVAEVKLSEIFTSIEGEGILLGTKTLFVRLAGCPLDCRWCDTQYAIPFDSGISLHMDKVKALIAASLEENTFKVNFTGGEPLVQDRAVAELAAYAHKLGLSTYLESACYDSIRFKSVLQVIDYFKIEFKLRDSKAVESARHDNLIKNELECLEAACKTGKVVYVKIIVTQSSDLGEFSGLVAKIFQTVSSGQLAGFIIQPSSTIDPPSLERLLEFYDVAYPSYRHVRIIPQLHKVLGAR